MNENWTKGPWTFDRNIWWENTPGEQEKHGGLIVYPVADEDLTIAEVNDYFCKERGKANAHLIAAAPELYAACRDIDRVSLVIESAVRNADPGNRDGIVVMLKNIRAALARARGEGAALKSTNGEPNAN